MALRRPFALRCDPFGRFSQCSPATGGVALLLAAGVCFEGCGGGGAATGPPPPSSIVVNVTPQAGSVLLGNTQNFAAAVTNTTNTAVTWRVNGVAGGNSTVGTISPVGVYLALADLPNHATVRVAATSPADATKSAPALITIPSDIAVSVTPGAASVELGGVQKLQCGVTSGGHPDSTILWSLSGASCPSACGTVDAASGARVAGLLGGWSCSAPGPAKFDGSYAIEALPVGHSA